MMALSLQNNKEKGSIYPGDEWLLVSASILLALGLVMMTSASVEVAASDYGDALYFLKKQLKFVVMGLLATAVVIAIPTKFLNQWAVVWFISAIILLALVLIPGVGHEVNGSTRWINLGFMTVQASEPAKLFIVMFIAFYLCKYKGQVCTSIKAFFVPFIFVLIPVMLLLKEPDFGAVVVLMLAVLGMMFMAGVKIHHFMLITLCAAGGAAALVFSAPYRLVRLKSFVAALADPFHEDVVYGSGYQLAQALIAFGRGEWLGVGLGNSIQKIYFLPEGHTDFVFAIIAEELGALSILLLLIIFAMFLFRALMIARKSEQLGNFFSAYLAYGIAFLFLGQIVINMAVNVGLLPTKGLTLPFLSSGGSSLIICMVMVGLLVRIDRENFEILKESVTHKKGRSV